MNQSKSTTKNVLLIHGTWQTDLYWNEAIPEFEKRGYNVHTPMLRYHDLPLMEGADKIATLSLLDYTEDLVKYAESLDSPPLIVGHSLGGLVAQMVAMRTPHIGVVAACPAPGKGTFLYYPKTIKIFIGHFLQWRPWAKPLMPKWEQYSYAGASMQPEEEARERFSKLVAESGRAYCEIVFPWLDPKGAATINYDAIKTPVLAIGAEFDNAINPKIANDTAKKYSNGTYTFIPNSDHMLFFGKALPAAMEAFDNWIKKEKIFELSVA